MDMTIGTWRISVERTPPTSAELATMYDHAARHWQQSLHRQGYDRAYRDLFRRLREHGMLHRLDQGGRVLDAGIGTGALSLALTETFPASIQIDGVDISAGMLAAARHALTRAGVPVQTHQQDMHHLPFADKSFDMVMSAHLLEHLDDPERGLAEMTRVLRPGAPLLVIVTRTGLFDALLQLKWRYTPIRPQQLAAWLQASGLRNIRRYELPDGLPLLQVQSVACIGFK
jgi:demethylmenaquinone methyltransferase/2-methoxy-6-polyprenyl-1,4-benzoquinol methylase